MILSDFYFMADAKHPVKFKVVLEPDLAKHNIIWLNMLSFLSGVYMFFFFLAKMAM